MYNIFRGECRLKNIINNIWNKIHDFWSMIYDLFDSIVIIDNSIANLVLKIGIILFVLIILKAIINSIFKPLGGNKPGPPLPPGPSPRTIDECISQEDIKFQLDKAEEEILNAIQRNKQQIADTLRKANQAIDVSWLESCNKVLRVSNTLDNNLAYYAKKNLEMSKFQYYAHLHFRSMIAADIVHREYEKVDRSYTEINRFIVNMKSNQRFKGSYKAQIHEQKDQIKLIRKSFLDRVHHMNHETAVLRDKIGAECGKRGREWWLERTRHKR